MLVNKIIFCATDKDLAKDVWPHPTPAGHFVPEEYKKMPRFTDNSKLQSTVKTCIPFLDAMTCGYIIPFDQDYLVQYLENDFNVVPANRKEDEHQFHQPHQTPASWKQRKDVYGISGKFMNKWLIKTPPGYSCYFMHPVNRGLDRWEIIAGVVDTDSYISEINFPYIMKKSSDTEFLIKKGTPLVQIFPFKRQNWKMWSGFYKEYEHNVTNNKTWSEFFDRYKKMFWHKKNFK